MNALPQVVLLVDDIAADRALADGLLRHVMRGFQVDKVGEVLTFTDRLGRGEFAAVGMEAALGWGSGMEVANIVRSPHPGRPVMLFTGSGCEALAAALERNLEGYVIKGSDGFLRLGELVSCAVRRTDEPRSHSLVPPGRAGQEELQQLLYAVSHDLRGCRGDRPDRAKRPVGFSGGVPAGEGVG